jgi:hypothetical protein
MARSAEFLPFSSVDRLRKPTTVGSQNGAIQSMPKTATLGRAEDVVNHLTSADPSMIMKAETLPLHSTD